jgi:chemotaxis protein MotB
MSHSRNRRRRGDHHQEEHADERWLLTYSDMVTLLMALFIIMWAVSSVNISKFDQLRASLRAAFSAKVLPESSAVLTGQRSPFDEQSSPIEPISQATTKQPAFKMTSITAQLRQAAVQHDLDNLKRIERQIEQFARTHGFSGRLHTSIDERGLVVRLLTDDVLFDTGQAVLKSRSVPLLAEISGLLAHGVPNPVRVEGNTDNVPISGPEFRSNWELSTARADAVVEFLLAYGVAPVRLSATGYADQRPVASNSTPAGRSLNRRVELVVLRRSFVSAGDTAP